MLRNEDRTDREVLGLVKDSEINGWVSSADVAELLRIPEEDRRGRASVTRRLSWMKQFGWLEYDADKGFALTEFGRALIAGKLRSSLEQTLERLEPGDRVLVMRSIAGSTFTNGTAVPIADAVRREYAHHLAKRPRSSRPRKKRTK